MPQPTPTPPKPPTSSKYRVIQVDDAPGMNKLETTLNTYAAAGYAFAGIISTPSLGVSIILEYQG